MLGARNLIGLAVAPWYTDTSPGNGFLLVPDSMFATARSPVVGSIAHDTGRYPAGDLNLTVGFAPHAHIRESAPVLQR
jgi:hypothetical protein